MYIYKITNKITGQCYIGQTQNPFERWRQHATSNDSPIQRAIKENGITNFTFEILEECAMDTNNRETYWIEYYHAYGEGYNTNRGEGEKSNTKIINMPPK